MGVIFFNRDSSLKNDNSTSSGVFCLHFAFNLCFWRFFKHLSIFDQKWHDLGSLKSAFFQNVFEKIFQNFAERRQIDVRRGMPSFASIPVTPRMLFKKNRGGVGSDPPPRRSRVN